jgi:very-short-patch-repair endonuclease
MKHLFNNPDLKYRRRRLRKDQTEAEKMFWSHVRNRQFHGIRFLRQYSIGPYILDLYCPENKTAVELDGGQHNNPKEKVYDTVRSEYLQAQGIIVLRFWDHEVLLDIQGVLAKVEEMCNPSQPPLNLRGGE